MNDRQLQSILESVKRESFPGKWHRLQAEFYKTRSLKHTISLKFGRITIRIADSFRDVPEDIIRILGLMLLAKLYRQRLEQTVRLKYKSYVETHILPRHKVRRNKISSRYYAEGKVYHLRERFDWLNRQFFKDRLSRPALGWSMNKSYRRLGFYSEDRNLLVISRIFDSKNVPLEVLDYLIYHEMLHIHFPPITRNGRKWVHTKAFREAERGFPGYAKIENWLKSNLNRL